MRRSRVASRRRVVVPLVDTLIPDRFYKIKGTVHENEIAREIHANAIDLFFFFSRKKERKKEMFRGYGWNKDDIINYSVLSVSNLKDKSVTIRRTVFGCNGLQVSTFQPREETISPTEQANVARTMPRPR